jgi:transposase
MSFILACDNAKLPYVIANPLRIKKFAGAIGQRAKNDRLDAALIAHYAEKVQPELTKLKSENIRLMSDLVTRRNQLLTMQTMERNRIQILPKNISSTITPILTALKHQIEKVEANIAKLIDSCPEYQTKNTILQSMPGVGKVLAASLISNVTELGFITNKQASSLIGVAPITRESGRFKGKRMIQGGRAQIRTVMYMAMMSAIQCNPVLRQLMNDYLPQENPKKWP